MNCPYCQQPCQPDSRYTNDELNEYGLCNNHKYRVEVWHNPSFSLADTLLTYIFHKYHNDRMYRIMCTKMGDYEVWELANVSVTANPVSLIRLSPITHNINPDNIDNKIQMLLTFM